MINKYLHINGKVFIIILMRKDMIQTQKQDMLKDI
jgi:hypothetical protein